VLNRFVVEESQNAGDEQGALISPWFRYFVIFAAVLLGFSWWAPPLLYYTDWIDDDIKYPALYVFSNISNIFFFVGCSLMIAFLLTDLRRGKGIGAGQGRARILDAVVLFTCWTFYVAISWITAMEGESWVIYIVQGTSELSLDDWRGAKQRAVRTPVGAHANTNYTFCDSQQSLCVIFGDFTISRFVASLQNTAPMDLRTPRRGHHTVEVMERSKIAKGRGNRNLALGRSVLNFGDVVISRFLASLQNTVISSRKWHRTVLCYVHGVGRAFWS